MQFRIYRSHAASSKNFSSASLFRVQGDKWASPVAVEVEVCSNNNNINNNNSDSLGHSPVAAFPAVIDY